MARRNKQLVLCISNDDYPASLEVNKLYLMLPDEGAESLDMVRVIDESGEDYLYPKELFAVLPDDALTLLKLSGNARRKVLRALETA